MKLVSTLLLLLLVAWLAPPSWASAAPVSWKKTNPTATVSSLTDIAYGAGLYVAVGGDKINIITSIDLQSWEVAKLPYEARTLIGTWSIAYGPEAGFVVTSGDNPTLVSLDGKTWTLHDQPFLTYRFDVIYGNGVYVAGPRSDYTPGNVAVSKDGATWTYPNVIPNDRSAINGVTFIDGQFVAYGRDGLGSGGLYSSVDGESWSLYHNITDSYPGRINQVIDLQAGSSTTLVALVGFSDYTALLTSTDSGLTWEATLRSPTTGFGGPLSSGNGVFFASLWNDTTNTFIAVVSFDNGQSWEPAPDTLISRATVPHFVNGQFVNVGQTGLIQVSHDDGLSFKSLDEGITTKLQVFIDTPLGYELNGHSFFVQTLNNPSTILGSADGVEWSEVTTLVKYLSQLTYYAEFGAWVATDSQLLVVSKDLVDWRVLGGPNVTPTNGNLAAMIAFTNQDGEWLTLFNFWNPWVSDSSFALYRSSGNRPQSGAWSVVASGQQLAQKVVAGNGAIVLLTGSGDLQSSTNGGRSWRKQAGPAGVVIASVQYVAKTFVAVGKDQHSVYVSSDSQAWTTFSFADVPQALVQTSVFVVEVDGEERAAVSLNDGSVRAYDRNAKAWAVWSTIPDNVDGVDGVRSNPQGVFVAVNTISNEIYTTAAA